MWKTQGAVATLRYVHHLPHGRAIPLGLELSEIDRIIASCDSFYRGGYRDWPTQWFKAGDQYLERGRKALASGYRETAAQMIFTAAACYHIAGYMHHDIGRLLPETRHSMLRAVELYWEAAPLFSPPSVLLEIPYDGTMLRPFLRLPAGVERPPCVILIGGANSNMINMHAVVGILPGPRHGDSRPRRPGAGRVLRAHRPAVPGRRLRPGAERSRRLGREGRSNRRQAPRHLRPRHRLAARDARGGERQALQGRGRAPRCVRRRELLSAGVRPHAGLAPAGDVQLSWAARRWRRASAFAARNSRWSTSPIDVDFPILTVCSADDETMPTTESAILKERVKGPVEVVTFPGKGHGGPSRLSLPLEADWMRDQLAS